MQQPKLMCQSAPNYLSAAGEGGGSGGGGSLSLFKDPIHSDLLKVLMLILLSLQAFGNGG